MNTYRTLMLTLTVGLGMMLPCVFQAADPLKEPSANELVELLKSQPTTKEGHDRKMNAIKQAAKIKEPDPQIIDALLDNLLYTPYNKPVLNPMQKPKFAVNPARDALKDIGQPVIPVLIEKLKHFSDPKLCPYYSFFLFQLTGGKEKAQQLIETVIAQTAEETEKSRLHAALDHIKSIN